MSIIMRRVANGRGGDCILLMGSEKTAAVDCGMAYCGPGLVEELKLLLKGRALDYLLATHTHYDHIGAMGYLRKAWPEMKAMGNPHAKDILSRDKVRAAIRDLSQMAAQVYGGAACQLAPYKDEDLRIDCVIRDGERVSLGQGQTLFIAETPGHTNCSLSLFLEEEKILFVNESIGCYCPRTNGVSSSVLTSFENTFQSIERCRQFHARQIVSPHYGLVQNLTPEEFLDKAREAAAEMYDFIAPMLRSGMSIEEVTEAMSEKYWMPNQDPEQPKKAFLINATATVKTVAANMNLKP